MIARLRPEEALQTRSSLPSDVRKAVFCLLVGWSRMAVSLAAMPFMPLQPKTHQPIAISAILR